jgi:signal transduction histidine kinase
VRVLGRPRPGGGYSLRVEDDGPGIAPDDVPLLFDRFRRFHATGPKAPEGYGLGLPIAQTIASFHKAVLRAESQVGRGTAFVLDFGG